MDETEEDATNSDQAGHDNEDIRCVLAVWLEHIDGVDRDHRHEVQDGRDNRAGERFDDGQNRGVHDRRDPGCDEHKHGDTGIDCLHPYLFHKSGCRGTNESGSALSGTEVVAEEAGDDGGKGYQRSEVGDQGVAVHVGQVGQNREVLFLGLSHAVGAECKDAGPDEEHREHDEEDHRPEQDA